MSDFPQDYVAKGRVGRLATVDQSGQPLVVPICYVYDGQCFYSVIDQKPKRVPAEKLNRVRNIAQNPKVSLLIDDYDEDWSKLRHVIIRGRAELVREGREQQQAIASLAKKYPQYRKMNLLGQPVIKITPKSFTDWRMGDDQ